MSHNHNGNGQQWELEPYTACEHCGDGSGTVHITVSCTCGAVGVYCRAHGRTDWGEYSGMTCAEVRRRRKTEEHDRVVEEEAARDRARKKAAEWELTHRYRYVCEGQGYYPEANTMEEAERAAAEYTHAGWDAYLPAPVPVTYWITDTQTGEETEYREICGPEQEPEPECTDAEGHVWSDINDVDDEEYIEACDEDEMRPSTEIDYCQKCGRYRAYYRAEPERGLPRFFKYSAARAK